MSINWIEVWVSILLGSAFSGGIILIQLIYKKGKFRKLYYPYVGNYKSYLKTEMEIQHYSITLERKGNRFIISGKSFKGNKDDIWGQIQMSTTIPTYGKGYYYHFPKEDEIVKKFGFYEIQLADKDKFIEGKFILVHQDIKGIRGEIIEGEDKSMAYIWLSTKNKNCE